MGSTRSVPGHRGPRGAASSVGPGRRDAPGDWSQAAVDHYLRVLDALAGVGLTAFTTLYHFTVPRWFAERGGWAAPDAVDVFARYLERIAPSIRDRTPYVCTVNEPQIVALFGYLLGYHPPGLRNPHLWQRVTRNLIRAHETAVDILAGGPQTGVCLQMPDLQPARPARPQADRDHRERRGDGRRHRARRLPRQPPRRRPGRDARGCRRPRVHLLVSF